MWRGPGTSGWAGTSLGNLTSPRPSPSSKKVFRGFGLWCCVDLLFFWGDVRGRDFVCPHRTFLNGISCQHLKKGMLSIKTWISSFSWQIEGPRQPWVGIVKQQRPADAEYWLPQTAMSSPTGHRHCCTCTAFVPEAKITLWTYVTGWVPQTEPKTGIDLRIHWETEF